MCMATDSVSYGGSAEEQQIDLSGSGRSIPTFAYGYAVQDRRPAVVILHDVFGPKPLYRDLGKRLADEGRAVTVIGFCMGGTLALFAGARIPALAGCDERRRTTDERRRTTDDGPPIADDR
jgi:dienelactone hydrolase